MKVKVDGQKERILISTVEGYRKDNTSHSKKRFENRPIHLTFTGNDAPAKAVVALMQKYGIRKEDL